MEEIIVTSWMMYFDSETGASSIELYNASKDQYRVAPFMRIPLPWPFSHGMASEKGKEMENIFRPTVNEILENFNIAPSSIRATKMWKRGIINTAKDTVVVPTDDKDTTRWTLAADEIRHAILPWATEVNLEFRVELRNECLMYKDVSTALSYDEDIRNIVSKIQAPMLARVEDLIAGAWRSVTFDGRQPFGVPHGVPVSNTPTVMILVSIGARNLWESVEEQLCRVVEDIIPSGMSISLEILPSNFVC
ncbi:hypothetical protein V496_00938 [Pseudogymnoascus sp. VKM F-4515 (FW-2607)]|nr:hypothetical protein V496_00938 [Pseudogymnoascus sp. VKM F-4515 (FW-2607)]